MAFYVSIVTQLMIGYSNVYPTGWLRVVAAVQGLVGFVFVVLVFGRFVAAQRPITDIFDKR
jgi:hypothetical protein